MAGDDDLNTKPHAGQEWEKAPQVGRLCVEHELGNEHCEERTTLRLR